MKKAPDFSEAFILMSPDGGVAPVGRWSRVGVASTKNAFICYADGGFFYAPLT
jgi:hypothetical protein